ncbi:MAG: hypothetical protein K2L94_01815 [Alphaproteobacteria bacterium]|nr:hypothetical protein [Alphaproteobacteria bacterium]
MRKILHFFAICLVPLAFQAARADDATDAARAATRRNAATTVVANTSTRQKSTTTTTPATPAVSRTATTAKTAGTVRERTTTTSTSPRSTTNVVNVESRSAITGTTAPRTGTTVQSRTSVTPTRTVIPAQTRTATPVRGATSATTNINRSAITRSATPTRTTTTTTTGARRTTTAATTARSATATADADARAAIMNKDYKTCREVYYNCMDEFCANKDAQLKRCACSSRIHEFDSVKKRLDNVEEKMLDFSQRLLTVNMDKEDAEALFKATEGELAFQQTDTSASKKILDEIAKKLQTGTADSRTEQNLSALSWSLNTDAAFDNIDSMLGASTTVKEGTALYSAALPVCREMAMEVCDEDALSLAQSGYLMMIEQDCTTVAKAYETQTDQAREKVRESSALLDMSRLDIYQKRNSDDILTCKKKMLDMLTNSTVCGTDLGKCLDTTGRYIDPSTGEAFLTENLVDLANLITRPSGDEKWTTAPGNDRFVTYLNSKKKYLEPAMENCQDIADSVWDAFIEDALAQIKLAQESKLEDMRQSCTALTTQCLSDTAQSLADFDARALSIFGVQADKTVKEMCKEVKNACTALLDQTGDTNWTGGMTDIATDTTYDTLLRTCREVGRNCIIQTCKSISGNFGLCENIQTSINRKSIINRTACWQEVNDCVAAAGDDAIKNIMERQTGLSAARDTNINAFYNELYGMNWVISNNLNKCEDNQTCIYDICQQSNACNSLVDTTTECLVCRLSEKIWGNCELDPLTNLKSQENHNKILDTNGETLLSWFAINTGTTNAQDSCRDTSCGIGYIASYDGSGNVICVDKANYTDGEEQFCPTSPRIQVLPDLQNCCNSNMTDFHGNCCTQKQTSTLSFNPAKTYFGSATASSPRTLCLPSAKFVLTVDNAGSAAYNINTHLTLVCTGKLVADDTDADKRPADYPNGKTVLCQDGQYVWVNARQVGSYGYYFAPNYGKTTDNGPLNFYNSGPNTDDVCTWSPTDQKWSGACMESGTPTKWQVGTTGN